MLPHNPFICPEALFRYYYERLEVGAELTPPAHLHPAVQAYREHRDYPKITAEETRIARAAYCGLVECLDAEIGRLLEGLRRSDICDNTLVIYTSDHGESAGENGLWTKSNFYDGSARVPMIWNQPGRIAKNTRQSAVVSLLDVGPTLAALAGSREPFGRGHDLTPLLDGRRNTNWPDEAVSLMAGNLGDPPAAMIRSGRYKLNRYHGYERPQLFDLHDDPWERTDLGEAPSRQEVCRILGQKLDDCFDGEAILRARQAARQRNPLHHGFDAAMSWTVQPDANSFDPTWSTAHSN